MLHVWVSQAQFVEDVSGEKWWISLDGVDQKIWVDWRSWVADFHTWFLDCFKVEASLQVWDLSWRYWALLFNSRSCASLQHWAPHHWKLVYFSR